MDIYTKRLVDLTDAEWNDVYVCNMGTHGSMRRVLLRLRNDARKDARVVMAYRDDLLLGCALIFKRKGDGESVIYNYVRPRERRKGLGTKLIKHARRGRSKPLQACLWDERSDAFYDNLIAAGTVIDSKGRWY